MTETKNLGGRPPILTPELHTAIVRDIANAIPYEYAAEANGIAERTLYNWLTQGKQDRLAGLDTEYSRLLQDIKNAERNRINEHIESIRAGSDKWTSAAWMLERRWWKHYSKHVPLIQFQQQLDEMNDSMERNNGEAKNKNT